MPNLQSASLAVPCFRRSGPGYTGVAWDRRKHATQVVCWVWILAVRRL